MPVIVASLAVGALGLFVTRRLVRRGSPAGAAHGPWALGLAAVVPAWMVVLVPLLGATPGVRPPAWSMVAWVLSAAAALLGAITSEAALRSAGEAAGRGGLRAWRLGAAAIVPAWVIALLAYAGR